LALQRCSALVLSLQAVAAAAAWSCCCLVLLLLLLLQLMKKKHAWMGVRELQEKAKAAGEEAKQAQQAFNAAQADANHDERPLKYVLTAALCCCGGVVMYSLT
jgi:hypothetical protein